jgi:predicted Zn-dependent protease
MKRKLVWICLLLIFAVSCQQVPITGRQQLSLVSGPQINAMGVSAYQQFLNQAEVVTGTKEAAMVKRVGDRIAKAVETYFAEEGMSERIQEFNWEFNLIKDEQTNAWAMPGGKVAVYTGLLPVAQDEAGLSVVMSHEVAHVVARHGEERMSQQLLTQLGGAALATALSQRPQQTQQLFMAAFGLGAQVGVLLPYSRLQEREADRLGLVFMGLAGYDPNAAIPFWQRMMAEKGAGAPPEFLSTHPSDDTRIREIQGFLPEAMSYYRRAG